MSASQEEESETLFRLLRYRADLDLQSFVTGAGLDVTAALPCNLFGYLPFWFAVTGSLESHTRHLPRN